MQKFLCDGTLGSLARRLRMSGIDTAFIRSHDPADIAALAALENRIILTRTTTLGKRCPSVSVYLVRSCDVNAQHREILSFFSISVRRDMLMSRCLACNHEIMHVEKETARGNVPEYIFHTMQEFSMCPNCNKFFWKGTHFKNIMRLLQSAHGK